GLVKADGLPDYTPPAEGASMGGGGATLEPGISDEPLDNPPYWGQEGVHEIYREWRSVLGSYPGDRILAAEAWVDPLPKVAKWVRPDEMHQAFNFAYLETPWEAAELRTVIDDSLKAFSEVGAPSTWVLSNHDVVRHSSRLALTAASLQGHGVGPKSEGKPDAAIGLRRARAASTMMLALPGSSYIYQGEELGLPEAIELPDAARQDPTWFRTNGERYGRDGCRVPIPWEAESPAFGFSPTGKSWLPQPVDWATYARDAQQGVAGSTLELYRLALALREEYQLGLGSLEWQDGYADGVIAYRNGDVLVIANTGPTPVTLPSGHDVLLASDAVPSSQLGADVTVWLRAQR
ncbi:MAG TPA: alpha-amylase family glycosyl hydrolase, partial [Homoserinimonas sp.]|nr:alpha-amylase family glycosyl hydrolase [Homoserinimonas sp.]